MMTLLCIILYLGVGVLVAGWHKSTSRFNTGFMVVFWPFIAALSIIYFPFWVILTGVELLGGLVMWMHGDE